MVLCRTLPCRVRFCHEAVRSITTLGDTLQVTVWYGSLPTKLVTHPFHCVSYLDIVGSMLG